MAGRVNAKGGSRYWRVKEVQVFGKVSGLHQPGQGVSPPDAMMPDRAQPDSGPPIGPAFAPLSPGTLTYFTFQENNPWFLLYDGGPSSEERVHGRVQRP